MISFGIYRHSLLRTHDEVAAVPAEVTLDAHAELLVLLLEPDARSDRSNGRTLELLHQSESEAT